MNAQIYTPAEEAAQDHRKLLVLLDQTIDVMPVDTDPAEYAAVAYVLVAETLASAARQGLLPVQSRFGMLTNCRIALYALPAAADLPAFQAAARAGLREAVCLN